MSHEFEVGVTQEMGHIGFRTGVEVVDRDDFPALVQIGFTQIASEEAGSTCDKNSFLVPI